MRLLCSMMQQMTDSYKRERTWAEEDRRENRVGNWRGFQNGGKRRKETDAHGWKEEKRVRACLLLQVPSRYARLTE
jgi:hypothetical protein